MMSQVRERPHVSANRLARRRLLARIVSILGTTCVAALIGFAAIAYFGVVNVHVVTSSSMQPALQVNDMIVARPVPAEMVEVGDIATISHPDGHLVTHRVLSNDPDPEGDGRLISMQGDDNDVADPQPYAVETADATLLRIPLAGWAFQALVTPPASYVAIGSLVLLALAALIPGRNPERRKHETTSQRPRHRRSS